MRGLAAAPLACALLASCASTRDWVTGERTLNRFTLEDDVEIGTKNATLILAAAEANLLPVDADDIFTRTVRVTAARLLGVAENRARMPPFPWEVHVVGAPGRNAWCLPGGQVIVFAGLMAKGMVRDEDELAAVLGHEIAHAAARHGTEGRTVDELRGLLAPFGRFLGSRFIELSEQGSAARLLGGFAVSETAFDQGQEIEADLLGLEMAARAGYDPGRAPAIWARLAAAESATSAESLDRTHPTSAFRTQALHHHLDIARYEGAQRVSSLDGLPARTGWTWTSSSALVSSAASPRVAQKGALPGGAFVASPYLTPDPRVLSVSGRVRDGVAEVHLAASRDLVDAGLRYAAAVYVERRVGGPGALVLAVPLAHDVELAARDTGLRAILPALPAGRYQLRARAIIGALWAESVARFEITSGDTRGGPASPR